MRKAKKAPTEYTPQKPHPELVKHMKLLKVALRKAGIKFLNLRETRKKLYAADNACFVLVVPHKYAAIRLLVQSSSWEANWKVAPTLLRVAPQHWVRLAPASAGRTYALRGDATFNLERVVQRVQNCLGGYDSCLGEMAKRRQEAAENLKVAKEELGSAKIPKGLMVERDPGTGLYDIRTRYAYDGDLRLTAKGVRLLVDVFKNYSPSAPKK